MIGLWTGFQSALVMPVVVIIFGYCYGLWSAMRNMLISVEIERTGLSDTLVTGLVTIAFTVAIIGGSIGGGKVYEVFGVPGIYLLMGILLIA
jgi:predicted MFS family arabinose efflux permease